MKAFAFAAVRGAFAAGLALFGLAALIGSSVGPPERSPTLNRFAVVETCEEEAKEETASRWPLRLVDLRTGEQTEWRSLSYERADFFSVAPWSEGPDGGFAAARWQRFTGSGSNRCVEHSGVALFSLPDGSLIKWVAMETLPTAPPVWAPGLEAKIIFPAGDGKLYSLNFDDPEPMAAEFPIVSDGPIVRVQEVVRPNVPAMENYLLASVVTRNEQNDYVGPQLWWLRLGPQAEAAVNAGPLRSLGDSAADPNLIERWPTAFLAPDGQATLAFLEGAQGELRYRLRLVPLGFGPGDDSNSAGSNSNVDALGLRRLAQPGPVLARCLTDAAPVFAMDGGWFLASQGTFLRRKMVRHQPSPASFASRR